MPQTPTFGFEYETPQNKPGITLTGDQDGSSPILAEQVDTALAEIDSRVAGVESASAVNTSVIVKLLNGLNGDNYESISTAEDATNTGDTWSNLATVGPTVAVTLEDPASALVIFTAMSRTDVNNVSAQVSVVITGSTNLSAGADRVITWDGHPAGNYNTKTTFFVTTFNAGNTTVQMMYRSGESHTATFANRRLFVLPFPS